MTVIGYARPQAGEPDSLEHQRRQLLSAGAERVVVERAATSEAVRQGRDRPLLDALIADVEPGQVLMVTSMDRLARSLSHLLTVTETLTARGAEVVFLSEDIATTGPDGETIARTLGALVELERVLRAARTAAGRAVAPRGRGRPRVMNPSQVARARAMMQQGMGPTAVAAALGVARPTLHRYLHSPTQAADVEPPL